jgi:hypothetical protein
MSITKKILQVSQFQYMIQSDLNNILPIMLIALKLVEQQKIDIADESVSAPITKTNKKENTDDGNIQETEKGIDQDNASGQELEDLKE